MSDSKEYRSYPNDTDSVIREIGIMQYGIISIIRDYTNPNQWINLHLLDIFVNHDSFISFNANGKVIGIDSDELSDIADELNEQPYENKLIGKLQTILDQPILSGFSKIKIELMHEISHLYGSERDMKLNCEELDFPAGINGVISFAYEFTLKKNTISTNNFYRQMKKLFENVEEIIDRTIDNIVIKSIGLDNVVFELKCT